MGTATGTDEDERARELIEAEKKAVGHWNQRSK